MQKRMERIEAHELGDGRVVPRLLLRGAALDGTGCEVGERVMVFEADGRIVLWRTSAVDEDTRDPEVEDMEFAGFHGVREYDGRTGISLAGHRMRQKGFGIGESAVVLVATDRVEIELT